MREGIVTRTLDANIETGPERFLLESREEFVQCALAAEQQPMHMPRLWRSSSVHGLRGQSVTLQNNELIEVVGERARGREPAHSRADHNGPIANQR